MEKINFYFRLEKECKVSIDSNGLYGEAYVRLSTNVVKKIDEETYAKIQEDFRNKMTDYYKVDSDKVVPVSREEYISETCND